MSAAKYFKIARRKTKETQISSRYVSQVRSINWSAEPLKTNLRCFPTSRELMAFQPDFESQESQTDILPPWQHRYMGVLFHQGTLFCGFKGTNRKRSHTHIASFGGPCHGSAIHIPSSSEQLSHTNTRTAILRGKDVPCNAKQDDNLERLVKPMSKKKAPHAKEPIAQLWEKTFHEYLLDLLLCPPPKAGPTLAPALSKGQACAGNGTTREMEPQISNSTIHHRQRTIIAKLK